MMVRYMQVCPAQDRLCSEYFKVFFLLARFLHSLPYKKMNNASFEEKYFFFSVF